MVGIGNGVADDIIKKDLPITDSLHTQYVKMHTP